MPHGRALTLQVGPPEVGQKRPDGARRRVARRSPPHAGAGGASRLTGQAHERDVQVFQR